MALISGDFSSNSPYWERKKVNLHLMKLKKPLLVVVATFAVIFLLIQLFPISLPANIQPNPSDIVLNGQANIEVGKILRTSCYDCHSNEVRYPWYSQIAPISWLVAHDVEEGREELNFSIWMEYDEKRMIRKLEEIAEEVEDGEMPLGVYSSIHSQASIDAAELEILKSWTRELRQTLVGN